MIAELFYPKELKEIIADLRAKDDLNEEALRQFKRCILKGSLLNLSLGSFFLLFLLSSEIRQAFSITDDFIVPVVLLLLGLLYSLINLELFLMCKRVSSKVCWLYNYGKYEQGVCDLYSDGGLLYHPNNFLMHVHVNIGGYDIVSVLKGNDFSVKLNLYKKGDEVLVAYDPSNPDHHVPIIKSYAEIFYLRRTPINERLKSMNSMHDA